MKRNKGILCITGCVIMAATLACGLGGGEEPTPPAAAPVASPSGPLAGGETPLAPAASPSGAVNSIEEVKGAVVFIEAEGTLIEPGAYLPNAQWAGTGFIIDPSGIAVTNNHVVTGAAHLQVSVAGESSPRNARVLAVSECSDLAVIDIDGEGFPFLEWRGGITDAGLEVYAAGFPLADPEYTLTKGIVSKARADGESPWASVDHVLEHDATIHPGNSGGPLVDTEARVVAVNYSVGWKPGASATLYYAIAGDVARPIVERLRQGEDVNSIGINGKAFYDETSGLVGIWVSSVASGSPADNAGVEPGDLLTSLENIYLGTDGTMLDYCKVLKSHSPEDTLAIEVLRFATGELLSGQLNGRELAVSQVFISDDGNGSGTGGSSTGYIDVMDAYSAIAVEIPEAWGDTDGSAWMDGTDVIGATIAAAPNLDQYLTSWDAPGMYFRVSDDLAKLGGYIQVLDLWRTYYSDCKLDNRYDYNDGYYRGKFDLFTSCGGPGGSSAMVLSAVPTDNSQAFIILLEIQMMTPEDEDIAVHALETFRVIGTLP